MIIEHYKKADKWIFGGKFNCVHFLFKILNVALLPKRIWVLCSNQEFQVEVVNFQFCGFLKVAGKEVKTEAEEESKWK